MIRLHLIPSLRRFAADERGNATIEFALYFTVFFMILATGVELAYLNMRHAMLERSVDLVVRDIRLSTGNIPTYDEVRTAICERAAVVKNCEENMRLEMVQVDPRAFQPTETPIDCINAEEEPRPVRNFVPGLDNDLMLLRACLKFKPILPSTGVGRKFTLDTEGYSKLIVTSAFVQEPR